MEHTWNSDVGEMKVREAIQEKAKRKNNQRAPDDLHIEVSFRPACFDASAERQRNRDTDDENKERKDQIGWGPAMMRF